MTLAEKKSEKPRARHKYNAKPTQIDAFKFASKAEARFYSELLILQQQSVVVGFLRQVPIHFKCGTIYRLDFLVFYADGRCEAIDIKGVETDAFKIKHKLMQHEYPWLPLLVMQA